MNSSWVGSSYDRNAGIKALHLVTAWASEQRLVLGQVKEVALAQNFEGNEVSYDQRVEKGHHRLNGRAIREHWGIENRLHWTLDVTFKEDQGRIRSGHSPRHLALLRRMAINALNYETTLRRSLKQKSKRAAMNNDYMMTVLNAFCQA